MGREWTWWWEGDGYVVGRYCGELKGGAEISGGGAVGGRDGKDRKDGGDKKDKDGKDGDDGSHESSREVGVDGVGNTKDGVKAGPSIRLPALPQPLPTPSRSGYPTAAATPNVIPKPVSHSMPHPTLVSPSVPSMSRTTAHGSEEQLPTPTNPVTGGSSTSLNANSQAVDSHSLPHPGLVPPLALVTEGGLPTRTDSPVTDGSSTLVDTIPYSVYSSLSNLGLLRRLDLSLFTSTRDSEAHLPTAANSPTTGGLSVVSSNVDTASLSLQSEASRPGSVSALNFDVDEIAQSITGLPTMDFGPIPSTWLSRVFPRERVPVRVERGDPTV